jgi:hypothetical protein
MAPGPLLQRGIASSRTGSCCRLWKRSGLGSGPGRRRRRMLRARPRRLGGMSSNRDALLKSFQTILASPRRGR